MITHIRCCGRSMTIEEAKEHTADRNNSCPWTWELLSAMLASDVEHPSNDDPSRISTTTLTAKCLRQIALSRYNPYEETPENMWARFRGTQFHKQLEAWAHPTSYGEARFYINDLGKLLPAVREALPRQDRSLSGSPDLVDPVVGVLYDYKRTKEVPRFDTVWGDHIEQLNVNRWLVDNADSVDVRIGENPGEGFDLSLPGTRQRFVPVDWQKLVIVYVDDKGPKPITVTESIDVPQKGDPTKTKKARVPAIWSDERIEEYIATRYIAARLALNTRLAPVPNGWEHQSHILCNYCPVIRMCAELERNGS